MTKTERKETITNDYTVLGFDTPQGHVNHHELRRHQHPWMESPVKQVVFEVWDDEAQMKTEVAIHWTNFTQYMKRKWPKGGSVIAVIMEDGHRQHASARICGHNSNESYLAAPLICRDTFTVVGLCNGRTYLEVVGVGEWLWSKRDEEATARCLIDPVARDNAAYHARMAALKANKGN